MSNNNNNNKKPGLAKDDEDVRVRLVSSLRNNNRPAPVGGKNVRKRLAPSAGRGSRR